MEPATEGYERSCPLRLRHSSPFPPQKWFHRRERHNTHAPDAWLVSPVRRHTSRTIFQMPGRWCEIVGYCWHTLRVKRPSITIIYSGNIKFLHNIYKRIHKSRALFSWKFICQSDRGKYKNSSKTLYFYGFAFFTSYDLLTYLSYTQTYTNIF